MDNDLLYRALADNTRRRLIRLLLSGSCCVSALAARLNISESAVSQHVGLLRRAGLLDGTRRGRFMHYAVNRQRLLDLARELEALAATHPDDKADEAARAPPVATKPCAAAVTAQANSARCPWLRQLSRNIDMSTAALYLVTLILLALSFRKDRKKTRQALVKAWKSFENILPQFLAILVLIGLMLAVLDKELITRLLGAESGALGMAIAAVIGSVTLIPGFIAFPLAASLLSSGAGYGQTAMFLTTLMMVGIVTLPLEGTFFGKRLALMRNVLAFSTPSFPPSFWGRCCDRRRTPPLPHVSGALRLQCRAALP